MNIKKPIVSTPLIATNQVNIFLVSGNKYSISQFLCQFHSFIIDFQVFV